MTAAMSGKQLATKNGKLELMIRIEFSNKEVSTMDINETIKQQIAENTIILYMKGSPKLPQCGFSSQASQALMTIGEKFAYVDILANPEIRANLPKISNWPTFPQLFVKGELVGGCDIMMEMFQSGQLQTLLKEAATQNS